MTFAGALTVVGIGLRSPAQATFEAAGHIESADKVFILAPDPIANYWVFKLNSSAESLSNLYAEGKERRDTYAQIVERITGAVRSGLRVCAVTYGHPGVAAFPFHESIRILRSEGYACEMLAGISAADCLFAELGVDPIEDGMLSYEATDFLLCERPADPACNLILWQIGAIAITTYKMQREAWNRDGLAVLAERLLELYPPNHEVFVYETSSMMVCEPLIERVELCRLSETRVPAMSTLFIPPAKSARPDERMTKRLFPINPA
jgi:uncharacterized protein YabN with tetrapyrrole methylase and pyrophosphatase domain